MVVSVTRSALDNFRRKARNSPNEIYAVLVGKKLTPNKILVTSFEYPAPNMSSPSWFEPDEASLKLIDTTAKSKGLRSLGAIHSHIDYLPIMSGVDMSTHLAYKDLVTGIVEVSNRRTRVVFWRHDSSLPCELTYT